MSSPDRLRRALRLVTLSLVTAVAFVGATLIVAPGWYASVYDRVSREPLGQACAGVTQATVSAAVASPRRDVDERPDGWGWTCRWRSSDDAVVQRDNPTLYVSADQFARVGKAAPELVAANEYGQVALSQLASSRQGEDSSDARRRGLGVTVLSDIGGAQVYVEPAGVDTTGYEARVVAVRDNIVVTVRYIAYRSSPTAVREAATRAAREAVRAV